MKTKLLLAICFITASINAFATHWRAGEISYRYLGNFQIEVTVTSYSKYDGISAQADRDVIHINWGDGQSDSVCRTNGLINPSGCRDGVLLSIAPSIKKSDYTALHTYAGNPPNGFYVVSTFDMNRTENINNIDNGTSINLPWYVEDTIFLSRMPAFNSSPVFLNPPVEYANGLDTFTYNSVAYDVDGDSVSFELGVPMQDRETPVPLYLQPDQYCVGQGFSSNSFQINSATGDIRWASPCQSGLYNLAFIMKEYRCGVLLSTVLRDMQLIVTNENNDPPILSSVHDTVITPGDSISFSVIASDPQFAQTVSLQSVGGGFEVASPATFQTATGNPATGIFSWKTDSSAGRKSPYIFSITASDNYIISGNPPIAAPLKTCQTFRVWIIDTSDCTFTSIEEETPWEQKVPSFRLHPNPATDYITISLDDISTSAEVIISDITGRKMLAEQLLSTNYKLHTAGFAAGVYFVTVTSAGRSATRKLVISR